MPRLGCALVCALPCGAGTRFLVDFGLQLAAIITTG